ncbi:hypothetical protein HFC70_15505 [Agrobacterium sp. a22-2]|uniref:hypothetical protein n=1 Tax=Agrobacterium sp. a22-2 TaxID=2283840 RepID=UPI001447C1EA|nr:hypothetical protein [Agrobacterium sp. a22-2]NKN37758.1 hypothetical protein [Agrobacterium sp. a22-2]
MTELQNTVSLGMRLKRTLWMSFSASVLSGIGGLLAFGIVAGLFAPDGTDKLSVDQDFFMVIFNVPPVSIALGIVSFFAQLAARPYVMDLVMLCLAALFLAGVLNVYYNYADPSSASEKIYLIGALVPGLIMIVAHWSFFKISAVNRHGRAMVSAA